MYLVDANIFLEVELGQPKGMHSKDVLSRFKDGELRGMITDFHVDAVIVVMENYKLGWRDIAIFLSGLLRYEGLTVQPMTLGSRISATSHMKNFGLNFDDALAYQCMMENGIEKILSYDADFDVLPDIQRVDPKEIA
ncbi:MAG: type II toxin-antitoxin system VapC family toxin [Methanocellales archaeon]|nr:type II toxin-antitoxin system VapC family toxin [Methanocellales archaeon]MDI6860375.1 type II toxin-antitoxin system VapC family toxin [Methanocellales archaeon]MDI6902810.1 type II toxin-antitoxin system VapC family toxin [Methanocellales archaeon]